MPLQLTATGTFSDASTQNVTTQSTWTVSDSTLATVGSNTGLLTIASAGKIWGGDVSVTATFGGIVGMAKGHVIATDSGSVNPLMPQFNTHWQALGLSPWGSWWGLQEGAGNPVSSGSTSLTLTATGATYSYALPNWTRKFVNLAQSTAQNLSLTNNLGPPPNWDSTGSMAFLVYGKFATPSVTTVVVGSGNANTSPGGGGTVLVELNTSCVPVLYCSGTTTAGTTALNDGRVHPVLLVYDKTNSRVKLYTDREKVTGSFGTLMLSAATPAMGLGNASVTVLNSASGSYGFFAFCTGSVAESLSDDGRASNFLRTLGWANPW